MSAVTASRYPVEYERIAPQLPGGNLPWLKQRRHDALALFAAGGFPSLREEEWRYTNVSAIEKKLFSPLLSAPASAVDQAWIDSYRLQDAWSIVLLNGRFSAELSSLASLPNDVLVLSMADALRQYSERVEEHFGKAVADSEHGFVAFNTAWFSDGLFVHIPAKQVLAKPLQLLHVVTESDALATTRNLIVVDPMAQAEVVETYIGADCA